MKKGLVLGGFLLVLGTEAGAQQLSNSDFGQGWEDCYPLESYENELKTPVGSQPKGWRSANVSQMGSDKVLVTEETDDNGNKYVRMENKYVGASTLGVGANAPGYLTLGKPWAYAKVKMGWPVKIEEADGGTYGGVEFKYRPDAISFRYMSSHGTENSTENFTVSAYSWKGSFTSTEKIGVELFTPITSVDMSNRDRVVLEGAQTSGTLVASATVNFNDNRDKWEDKTIELNYQNDEIPEYFNIIFSSADYYGDRSNIGAGNVLCIDDVKLIYYSDLKSLSYDGTPINIDDPKNIQIAAKNFDLSKVSCTSGKGADIQKSYDPATRILTITINGEDVLENTGNHHEYSVKIVPPASEVTGPYNRWITVHMGVSDISESANNINITSEEDGEVSFGLDQFLLDLDGSGPKNYGPVTIPNAKLSYAADKGIDIVTEKQNVLIEKLGTELPIILTAHLSESKKLTADLNIGEGFVIVNVGDVPFTTFEENGILKVTGTVSKLGAASVKGTANEIDLTGAKLAEGLKTSDFSAEPNNTLYKISEAQTLDGNNVIQNGTCKNLVLTDGLTFNAPEGFKAAKVTFNRKFTAGQLSTVVLPFSFDVANVNGTVYKLESVENGVLSFKSVKGTADANVPYLVQTEGDNLFKTETPKNVTVALTPKTVENKIEGTGVTHVGNFGETMKIASDEQTSWYGYTSEGKFVKVSDGTIKPFRTAINSTSATTQNSFALKLDGTVTGILNLENPNAKVDVYTVSGVCVRKNVPAASALNGLSRGVYIVGGQKVVK